MTSRSAQHQLIPTERIERCILLIRRKKVMLDVHLADLYQVSTGTLNQAVKRNMKRFPKDFMFQLTPKEMDEILISQIVISSSGHGGRRHLPFVFTEQGVAMLSSILRSDRAVQVNIAIMRAFVRLREWLANNKNFAHKLAALERKLAEQDKKISSVFDAIQELMTSRVQKNERKIGFQLD